MKVHRAFFALFILISLAILPKPVTAAGLWIPYPPDCPGTGGTSIISLAPNQRVVLTQGFADDKITVYVNNQLVYDESILCNPSNHYVTINQDITRYFQPGLNTVQVLGSCPCGCKTANACAYIDIRTCSVSLDYNATTDTGAAIYGC